MIYITYFVHGTTTDNEKNVATGWQPGELSELGTQQSKNLGQLVKNERFDAIFCSDLKRAVASAVLAFGDKYEIIHDQRLREINYGNWNGHPDDFKNSLPDYINKPFPAGESYHDVEKRLRDFLDYLKSNHASKHVAVVAHQAPQFALEVLCNGKTWPEAIASDWRKTGKWQAGWEYIIK